MTDLSHETPYPGLCGPLRVVETLTGELARHSPASVAESQRKVPPVTGEVLACKTPAACVSLLPHGCGFKEASQKSCPGCWDMQVQGSPQRQC